MLQDSDSDDSPAEMDSGNRAAGGFDPDNFMEDLVGANSTEFSKGGRNNNRTGMTLT